MKTPEVIARVQLPFGGVTPNHNHARIDSRDCLGFVSDNPEYMALSDIACRIVELGWETDTLTVTADVFDTEAGDRLLRATEAGQVFNLHLKTTDDGILVCCTFRPMI